MKNKIFVIFLCVIVTFMAGGCNKKTVINENAVEPVELPTSNEQLTIGIWNGSYHIFDEPQLNQLAEAGINLIIGVNEKWTGGSGMLGVLERARLADVKVIADFREWDEKTLPAYAGHPAIAGYLTWDEPSTLNLDSLKCTKKAFDKIMPEASEFYVNLNGKSASYPSLYGEEAWHDYEKEYVDCFVDGLELEKVAYDNYGLLDGAVSLRPSYYNNLEIMATTAKEKNIPFQFTILSSGHSTTDAVFTVPTAEELRWQMAMGLTFGAKELVHYVYTSHEEEYSTMVDYETLATTPLYDDVKQVNLEYLKWDGVYLNYKWQGIAKLDNGKTNEALEQMKKCISFTEYGGIKNIKADGDLLIGVFADGNNDTAFMITNAGESKDGGVHNKVDFEMKDVTATMTFEKGCKCVAVIQKGETTFWAVDSKNEITIPIDSYEGVFVIPIYE